MVDITDEEIEAARERGRIADATEPRAKSASYDAATSRLIIELKNGSTFIIPVHLIQGLAEATYAERAEIELWGDGFALRWEALDLDFTVPGLVAGIFGTRKYMSSLAGRATSPAKAAAARANGAKGGRPRKVAS
jgi:hypothetical protein